jgi:NADH-quinone oxidoreductase subunit K
MHPVIPYTVAALLFGVGVYGVLVRRNAILLLMAVELMLNAVNLVLVTADTTVRAVLPDTGQVTVLFVIVLAAAEIGVGLAVVLALYRLRRSVAIDEVPLAGEDPPASGAGGDDGPAGGGDGPAGGGDGPAGGGDGPAAGDPRAAGGAGA